MLIMHALTAKQLTRTSGRSIGWNSGRSGGGSGCWNSGRYGGGSDTGGRREGGLYKGREKILS